MDYNAKKRLYELLLFLNKTQNTTIIIVTHEVDYIERICTRAIILSNGEVQYDGVPNTISDTLKHTISITVTYASIRNEKLANVILQEALFEDKEKQLFTHHFLYEDEKNAYLEKIIVAFNILEISTGITSLREVFENVLQEVHRNK